MKKTLALDLYKKNHSLPRKELIALFIKELNTTENSARTHINNASKTLHASLGLTYRTRNTSKPTLKKEQAKAIIVNHYANMTRMELAKKIQSELGLKSVESAQTHISRSIKELGLSKS